MQILIYYFKGKIYYKLNYHEKSIEFNEKALKILIKLFGEEHADVAESLNNIGILLF